jgi:hypothetical protein
MRMGNSERKLTNAYEFFERFGLTWIIEITGCCSVSKSSAVWPQAIVKVAFQSEKGSIKSFTSF